MGEQPEVREARLRLEFAQLYPGVEPTPGYMLSDRVPAKEHFEFRRGTIVTGHGLPGHVAPIR